jgi:hypothetical protein
VGLGGRLSKTGALVVVVGALGLVVVRLGGGGEAWWWWEWGWRLAEGVAR